MIYTQLKRSVISIAIFFSLTVSGHALDEGGCLFCHQYPGLVRLEEPNKLRILHIDEIRFADSIHGEINCKKCHTTINYVPHTGKKKINCTASCHQTDEEQKMVKEYPLRNFHKKEQSYIIKLENASSCAVCHQLYPHKENNVVRAFLNMHTGFMRCEVCHINKRKYQDLTFEWKDTQGVQFSGKPFGTYYNPRIRMAGKKKNHISRITVFSYKNGEKLNLINTWDIDKAKKYLAGEKMMNPEEKRQAFMYFHKEIEKKEAGVACNECHSSNSLMDFRELGFDEKKIKNLKNLNLKGLVTKYKIFYLPGLFEF